MGANDKPHLYRFTGPKGLEFGSIDRDEKTIRNFSVIMRGEALGHDVWIDETFLRQAVREGNAKENGIKTRFTHPGLSGDGLGTLLGRTGNFRKRDDKVLADLKLFESAEKSPKGNIAEYVMNMAEESPDLFGASIVFDRNRESEEKFYRQNQSEGKFVSPDDENTSNLQHVRLASLRAADLVDEPAANADGLFSFVEGSELPAQADELLSYVLGLTEDEPEAFDGGIHPERIKIFFSKFLAQHHLVVLDKWKDSAEIVRTRADQDNNNTTTTQYVTDAKFQAEIQYFCDEIKKLHKQVNLFDRKLKLLKGGT